MMNSSPHFPSESYTTLVEKDMGPKANSEDMITYNPTNTPKKFWVDRILGLFCAKSSINNEGVNTQVRETPEVGGSLSTWPSPWILPVYVISNQHDADKHPVTKIAKCTIDTGNMQGNIVSRDFVENVLGFPSSSFGKMTKEEESGGTGITGEPHIPLGAIHLTWYHKNSTRVFRDMRFLISPAQHCDLIIGAWSIQKDKILDVPCLPAGDMVGFKRKEHQDKDLLRLEYLERDILEGLKERKNTKTELDKNQKRLEKKDKTPKREELIKALEDQIKDTDKGIKQTGFEVDIAAWLIRVYYIAFIDKEGESPERQDEATGKWKEIDLRWYDTKPEIQVKLEEFYKILLKVKELKLEDGRGGGKSTGFELL